MHRIFRLAWPLVLAVALSACDKKAEPVVEAEQPTSPYLQVQPGEQVLAPFFDEHAFSGKWAPATIVAPASDESKGAYEVEFLMGTPDLEKGEKRLVKDVVRRTHPAQKDELKIGATVLTTGENPEDPEETKMCTWRKAVVTRMGDDTVEVEFFHVYKTESAGTDERFLHNVFIIDEAKP